MKAIKITQEVKDKNKKYNLNFVKNTILDAIIIHGIPNKFHITEPVSGGYRNRTDLHELDGWLDVVIPTYNLTNQRLGDLIESGNTFTYEVIDLSQTEIDDLLEETDANEAREKIDNYRFRGGEFIEQVRTKMWRRVHKFPDGNNGLTKVQVGKLDRWFQDIYNTLLVGNFRESRRLINNLVEDRDGNGDSTLLETEGMLDTALWFQTKIVDYFNNNYDL